MPRYLLLNFRAPLMYFGGLPTKGRYAPPKFPLRGQTGSSALPTPSFLGGLIGNALGWERHETARQEALQLGLRYAAGYIEEKGIRHVDDFDTASLRKSDEQWTTRGYVATRNGGPETYRSPHVMITTYVADGHVRAAVALPDEARLDVDQVAQALDRPARPLFIGRKACAPAEPILLSTIHASCAADALAGVIADGPRLWDVGEGPETDHVVFMTHRMSSGLHSGSRKMFVSASRNFQMTLQG